jgi:tRNA-binding protein
MHTESAPIDPYQAFGMVDLRVGRITRTEINKKARVPAYKLWIDFGPLGERTSSAQITDLYQPEELVGRLIVAAVNLGSRLIGGFKSEALVMGVGDAEGRVVLLAVERDVAPGSKIY